MTEERLQATKGLLLDLLQESYDRFAWHGPNLTQALTGVDVEQAGWRPPFDGSAVWNIQEIVQHVASVMRRCSADLGGTNAALAMGSLDESRTPLPGPRSENQWRQEVDQLQQSYEMLRQAVSEIAPARLAETSPSRAYGRTWSVLNQVYGIALHNVYHAAQIVGLRKAQQRWTELS